MQQCPTNITSNLTSNFTTTYSKLILGSIGLADGIFSSYSGVSNVTNCRKEAIRLIRLTKEFGQVRLLMPADSDQKVRIATDFVKQSYPFQYHCFHLGAEGHQVYRTLSLFRTTDFFNYITHQTGKLTDQIRMVNQIIGISKSQSLEDKHFYVLGKCMGTIFNLIAVNTFLNYF